MDTSSERQFANGTNEYTNEIIIWELDRDSVEISRVLNEFPSCQVSFLLLVVCFVAFHAHVYCKGDVL